MPQRLDAGRREEEEEERTIMWRLEVLEQLSGRGMKVVDSFLLFGKVSGLYAHGRGRHREDRTEVSLRARASLQTSREYVAQCIRPFVALVRSGSGSVDGVEEHGEWKEGRRWRI